MNTTIRLKIKKEVDTPTARKILKLKGNLIAQSFTDLIHYDDADENTYIHYFTTEGTRRQEATTYILSYIDQEGLNDLVHIVS